MNLLLTHTHILPLSRTYMPSSFTNKFPLSLTNISITLPRLTISVRHRAVDGLVPHARLRDPPSGGQEHGGTVDRRPLLR